MTQERFLKLLDNPDLLASISYEELKTLALTYPYSHNLRYLLAIKSAQDELPDYGRNLAAAAACSVDRSCLLRLIPSKKMSVSMVLSAQEEPVLELKPIATVKRELEARAPFARRESSSSEEPAKFVEMPQPKEKDPSDGSSEAVEPVLDLTRKTENKFRSEQDDQAGAMSLQPTEPILSENAAAQFQELSFSVWISQFNPPCLTVIKTKSAEITSEEVLGQPKKVPENEQMDKAAEDIITPQMLAEKSVTESKSIVSETLANLYESQGYRDKAIEMYERLRLAFPDKSAYFAAQIQKLKK